MVNAELSTEELRKRIRRAIAEREEFERLRYSYRVDRAYSVAKIFDGFAVGLLYVMVLGFFIGGYETEAEQVARNWFVVLGILSWFIGRALPRYEESRTL